MSPKRYLSGNWNHFWLRVQERIHRSQYKPVELALMALNRRAKNRKLPNQQWYFSVYQDHHLIGHICGQGVWVSTVYSRSMKPRGQQVK